MAWTDIADVADTDVLAAADLAVYLANMEYLHTPLTASYFGPGTGANLTTSSGTWAAISANFQLSLTTVGEHVLVSAFLVAEQAQFDVQVDGTRLGNTPATTGDGSFGTNSTSAVLWPYSFMTVLDLAAGAHTFDLMWKTGGTATVYSKYKPWFMVRALKL